MKNTSKGFLKVESRGTQAAAGQYLSTAELPVVPIDTGKDAELGLRQFILLGLIGTLRTLDFRSRGIGQVRVSLKYPGVATKDRIVQRGDDCESEEKQVVCVIWAGGDGAADGT
jgi:hypothetical protein